jgi:hypothetical protein
MAYSDGYAGGYAGASFAASELAQYINVPWGELEATIYSLDPGNSYEIAVAAYDHAGRTSGFSTAVTVSTSGDTTPPGTPAPPTLTPGVLEITVTHTLGLNTGGTYNLAVDLAEIEIHMSTTSGFTPTAGSKVSGLKADNSNLVSQTPVVVSIPIADTATRFFKAIAVDKTGNRSDPSGQVSTAPLLVGSTQIINRTIQELDIALDAITQDLIASRSIFANNLYVADFDNLAFNPGAEADSTLTPHAPFSSLVYDPMTPIGWTSGATSFGTSVTADLSTLSAGTLQAGDLMLAAVTASNNTPDWSEITAGGWTRSFLYQNGTLNMSHALFYKVAVSGAETDPVFWTGGSSHELGLVISVIRNFDPAIYDITHTWTAGNHLQAGTSDRTPPNQPITTVTDNALVMVYHYARGQNYVAGGSPSGYTAFGNNTGTHRNIFAAYRNSLDVGVESPGDWTHSVGDIDNWAVWTVALRPTLVTAGGTWSVDATNPRTGTNAFKYDPAGQTSKARLVLNVTDGDPPSNPDALISIAPGQWLVILTHTRAENAVVANDPGVAFVWYDKDLVVISENEQLNTNAQPTYAETSLMAQAPASAAYASVELRVANESNDNPVLFDDILVRRALEGNLIVDGTIEGNHLSSVTIEVAKYIESTNYVAGTSGWRIPGDDTDTAEFNNVTVRGELIGTSGTLENLTIVGAITLDATPGYIRTSASGRRIELRGDNLDKILFYSGDPLEHTPGDIEVVDVPVDNGILLDINGPIDTTDTAALNFISFSSMAATTGLGNPGITVQSAKQGLTFAANNDSTLLLKGTRNWLRLRKDGAYLDSTDAVATDTIFDIYSGGPIFSIIKRAGGRGDIEFHGDTLTETGRLPSDASQNLDNLTTITATSWANYMTPTLDYTHIEDKEVSVQAWGTVHADQASGTATSVRCRLQISLDNGASWDTSNTAGRHDVSLAAGERVSLNAHHYFTGTMTDDVIVRMQVYSTSSATDFRSGYLMRTVKGNVL